MLVGFVLDYFIVKLQHLVNSILMIVSMMTVKGIAKNIPINPKKWALITMLAMVITGYSPSVRPRNLGLRNRVSSRCPMANITAMSIMRSMEPDCSNVNSSMSTILIMLPAYGMSDSIPTIIPTATADFICIK